jgi:hypothetical protein
MTMPAPVLITVAIIAVPSPFLIILPGAALNGHKAAVKKVLKSGPRGALRERRHTAYNGDRQVIMSKLIDFFNQATQAGATTMGFLSRRTAPPPKRLALIAVTGVPAAAFPRADAVLVQVGNGKRRRGRRAVGTGGRTGQGRGPAQGM